MVVFLERGFEMLASQKSTYNDVVECDRLVGIPSIN
jgi:hypothetical protein